ncbi:hydroxymethylglutaryl-CoA synthase 1-like [Styela clava]
MPHTMDFDGHSPRPENIGIVAVEIYFPSSYVDQVKLEEYDEVSAGKYTKGLGQLQMGFCSDNEDINSLCLTVLANLMEKHGISYSEIGRLEVGTETIIDKSKSVKSALMQLFEESGNFDVEGIDTTNACYGGTSALFNAIQWMESSSWDGRYAVVICGDIAVYSEGNARCTGGAGAIAMLIGPNAPLVFEPGLRATYMRHAYDFYKPDLTSEYPVVDGKLSVKSYISALDNCYQNYCRKASTKLKTDVPFSLRDLDFMVFHSPYCKLVKKSLARLALNDFLQDKIKYYSETEQKCFAGLENLRETDLASSIFDKSVETTFMTASNNLFESKTHRSLLIASRVGNMYTPSLYSCLVSVLISHSFEELSNKRIGLFSYGSGLASSMFSMKVCNVDDDQSKQALEKLIYGISDVKHRLDRRQEISPEDFTKTLKLRASTHLKCDYTPSTPPEHTFPGTFYLTKVDDKFRRTYDRTKTYQNGFTNGH